MTTTTTLETYDYDLGWFTTQREWDDDVCDEQAGHLRGALGGLDDEAWRLMVWRGRELLRVRWLSRPTGF